MPTTYTHDAFGRETYEKLAEPIKCVIKENKIVYLIGLHGPDIFFYYKPYKLKHNDVADFGHSMHKKISREFFEEGVRACKDSGDRPLMAYLMGFVCHYILDSRCHPFVFRYQKESGLSHGEIETNLDRYYMERDGKNPFSYHPASAICASGSAAETIRLAFPQFSEKEILKSLTGMKFFCDLTVTGCECKRRLFHRALKMVHADRDIGSRIIEREPNPETYVSTEELICLYDEALKEVPAAMQNLYLAITEGEPLGERFDRNFC